MTPAPMPEVAPPRRFQGAGIYLGKMGYASDLTSCQATLPPWQFREQLIPLCGDHLLPAKG